MSEYRTINFNWIILLLSLITVLVIAQDQNLGRNIDSNINQNQNPNINPDYNSQNAQDIDRSQPKIEYNKYPNIIPDAQTQQQQPDQRINPNIPGQNIDSNQDSKVGNKPWFINRDDWNQDKNNENYRQQQRVPDQNIYGSQPYRDLKPEYQGRNMNQQNQDANYLPPDQKAQNIPPHQHSDQSNIYNRQNNQADEPGAPPHQHTYPDTGNDNIEINQRTQNSDNQGEPGAPPHKHTQPNYGQNQNQQNTEQIIDYSQPPYQANLDPAAQQALNENAERKAQSARQLNEYKERFSKIDYANPRFVEYLVGGAEHGPQLQAYDTPNIGGAGQANEVPGQSIGFNHRIHQGDANQITLDQAYDYLRQDVTNAQNYVKKALNQEEYNKLSDKAKEMLTDFAFHMGEKFREKLPKLVQAVIENNEVVIRKEYKKYFRMQHEEGNQGFLDQRRKFAQYFGLASINSTFNDQQQQQ